MVRQPKRLDGLLAGVRSGEAHGRPADGLNPAPMPAHLTEPPSSHLQLAGSTVPVTAAAGNTTVGAFLESTYGYKAGWEWWCVLILLGFIAALRAASMLAVRYLNFQKR